jgi:hypothetical protein
MGGYLPCRVLVLDSGGVEEIWYALSGRAADGTHARDRLRDILFAALENQFPNAVTEVRGDRPAGPVGSGQAGPALAPEGWPTTWAWVASVSAAR